MEKQLITTINQHFPGIKELSVTYENGFKIKFNDSRYNFSEVYRVVREVLIFK